jgi:hypothetical protein
MTGRKEERKGKERGNSQGYKGICGDDDRCAMR